MVDDVEIPVRLASVVVVQRDESTQLDWEVVAESTEPIGLELHRAHLHMTVITGADADAVLAFADLDGPAAVVRFVETTVVFRGDGDLEGFDAALLAV